MISKIRFLEEMFKTQKNQTQILQFLVDQQVYDKRSMDLLLHEDYRQHSTKIAMLLNDLQKEEKLQLVDYEWSILPKSVMRLSIVGPHDKKEFGDD